MTDSKEEDDRLDPNESGTGAKGHASDDLSVPFEPRKDDKTPLGDTDQHSKVPSHGHTDEEQAARASTNAADD